MKFIIQVLMILPFSIFCQEKEFPMAEYYYNLNIAYNIKDQINYTNDSIYKATSTPFIEYLQKAFNSLPINYRERIKSNHYEDILKSYYYNLNDKKLSLNDTLKAISIIKSFQSVNKEESLKKIKDKQIRALIEKYQSFRNFNYDSKINKAHTKEIKKLFLLDQFVRKSKEIDSLDIPKKYRDLNVSEGDALVFEKLLIFFKKHKIKDNFMYKKNNIGIFTVLVHLTSYNKLIQLKPYIDKLLKEGFLTPNEYTWIYDRSYNETYETFYYYYCLNHPFKTKNYIPEEKLSEKEKSIINERRRKIGIPPIPFAYTSFF